MEFEGICIMTCNVARLARFYCELFETTSAGDDEHTTMKIGLLGLAFWRQDSADRIDREQRKHCHALIFSSQDVDVTYQRARQLGAAIQEPPKDQTWGCRAFVLNDPDGNRIDIFGKL